jgi:pyruvate-formate lyase-activating enzyme
LVSPCCASLTEATRADDFDFATNTFLDQQRQAALADRPAPACENCWRQEQQNPPSRRYFSNLGHDPDIRVELNRVDITTQNICNLACIMCSSYSSSTWAREEGLKDQDYSFEDKLRLFRRLDHTNIYQMHFTGGEPLMTTEHLRMLDIYAESAPLSQLHISYNTNATFFPDQRVIDRWQQARAVDLVISLDGTGAAAELIRWPCNWSQVSDNVGRFYELKKILPGLKIGFISVASNYNLWELADVIEFARSHDTDTTVHFQVNHRPYFAPAVIPQEYQSMIKQRLAPYRDLDQLMPGLDQLVTGAAYHMHQHSILTYLDQLDQRRGTDWRNTLKFGEFYQNVK